MMNTFLIPGKPGFRIEIYNTDKLYRSFLYHFDYGKKVPMLELPQKNTCYDEFIDDVMVDIESYIDDYIKKYMHYPISEHKMKFIKWLNEYENISYEHFEHFGGSKYDEIMSRWEKFEETEK